MDFLTPDSLPPKLAEAIFVRSLVPEQILFRQGDNATNFYLVKTGRLKIIRRTLEQRTVTLQSAKPGDSFGESALLSDLYSQTAIAEVPSQVIAYPKSPLMAALRRYPDLAAAFINLLIQKNEVLAIQLELRDIRSAHLRVLQYLRYLAKSGDQTIVEFDRPLKNIANDLGLTSATLSRALARLEQEGVISREQSSVKLHNSSVA